MLHRIKKLLGKDEEESFENHINSIIFIKEEKMGINEKLFLYLLKEEYGFSNDIKINIIKNTINFRVSDMICEINIVNNTYYDEGLEKACDNAHHWKEAATELKAVKYHCIISVSNKVLTETIENITLQNNIFLTRITAALAEHFQAFAVFWRSSNLINKASEFSRITKERFPTTLPLELWIDFGLERSIQYKYSLFTRGLEAFSKREIEIRDRKETPQELAIFAYNLVYYLIRDNITPSDGTKISGDNNKLISCVEEYSMIDKSKRVLVLDY